MEPLARFLQLPIFDNPSVALLGSASRHIPRGVLHEGAIMQLATIASLFILGIDIFWWLRK
jgi:hypothetical protein